MKTIKKKQSNTESLDATEPIRIPCSQIQFRDTPDGQLCICDLMTPDANEREETLSNIVKLYQRHGRVITDFILTHEGKDQPFTGLIANFSMWKVQLLNPQQLDQGIEEA